MKALVWIISDRHVAFIGRWLLGLVFIASALGKIVDPAAFADNVAAYRLLPVQFVNLFAMVMPWLELLVGLSLINRVGFRSGALLAVILDIVFIGAASSAIARGLDIECGCITIARSKVGWSLIIRDAVLLVLATMVLLHSDRPKTVVSSRDYAQSA